MPLEATIVISTLHDAGIQLHFQRDMSQTKMKSDHTKAHQIQLYTLNLRIWTLRKQDNFK